MRNGQNNNNKRMRNNRSNNSSHSNNSNNNNRRGQNPMTRVFESNGPDIKIRGTASHVAEKYVQLARDARSSGDPVASENYYQHAEHYFRLIATAQEQFRQNQPQPRSENEMSSDDNGGDEDAENYSNFGAEPGFAPSQQQPQPQPPQPAFAPREPQAYQPREPREHQPREPREHQPREQREHQPREQRPQYQPQPRVESAPQPAMPAGADDGVDRLPSFITGPQPQVSGVPFDAAAPANGGERFPPRRRRRPHAPRPEGAAAPATAGDDFNPGNS
ncbi:MAG: hypothetical protein JWR73_456 [Tardiphaga sp.]|nr:hypothetical protein [Tardiphaga sp.]